MFRGTGPLISFWSKFSCQAVSPFPPPADSLPLSFGDGTLLLSFPPPGAMSRNRSAQGREQQQCLMLRRQQAKDLPNCFTLKRSFEEKNRAQVFFYVDEKWFLDSFSSEKVLVLTLVFAFQVQQPALNFCFLRGEEKNLAPHFLLTAVLQWMGIGVKGTHTPDMRLQGSFHSQLSTLNEPFLLPKKKPLLGN